MTARLKDRLHVRRPQQLRYPLFGTNVNILGNPPGPRSAEAVRIVGEYLSWEPGLLECDASPNMIIPD